jgi:glycosyltransferase involved in cell wall biosynthesis
VIITRLDAGGMERFCVTLCNAWAAQGRPCSLVALHPATLGTFRAAVSDSVDYRELNRSARWSAPALARVCRERPDEPVLVLGLEICAVLVFLKRLGWIRNPICYRESTAVLVHCTPFWQGVIRQFVSRADGLIVQSRQALSDLGRLFPVRQPVCLARNPCLFAAAANPPPCRVPKSRENLRVLCVGRLEPMKGQSRLIEALPLLRSRFPGLRLTIAGTGSEAGSLQRLIRVKGLEDCVRLTGLIQDPERLYLESDLLILPSYYEGLPNVLIEALALGCPVVAARGEGGTEEWMTELDLGAFLVTSDSFAGSLAERMDAVCSSRPEQWETARKRLIERTHPEGVANQIWEFLASKPGRCEAVASAHENPGGRG